MAGTKSVVAEAVAWAALNAYAKRAANRSVLQSGSTWPDIDLKISGTVDGEKVAMRIDGSLVVGEDNPTGSTRRPPMDRLLGEVIARLPKTRAKVLAADASTLQADQLDPPAESLTLAKVIIDKLSKKSPRAGSVKFQEA